MYFSGKISNSILSYLESKNFDSEDLYELTGLPFEFLRDPSAWLEADKIESLLSAAEEKFQQKYPSEDLISQAGHACNEIRSWGALDSVLKMMQKPEDLYLQPQRFLSYFISPELVVSDLVSGLETVNFSIPISSHDYPLTADYIVTALEALPQFVGKQMSSVKWQAESIQIQWQTTQQEFSVEKDDFIHPQLLQSIVQTLEETQNELEKKNEEILNKEKENRQLKKEFEKYVSSMSIKNVNQSGFVQVGNVNQVSELKKELERLNDYLVRSQQLVTLLVAQGKLDKQAKMAMKKVGWENVLFESPKCYRNIISKFN